MNKVVNQSQYQSQQTNQSVLYQDHKIINKFVWQTTGKNYYEKGLLTFESLIQIHNDNKNKLESSLLADSKRTKMFEEQDEENSSEVKFRTINNSRSWNIPWVAIITILIQVLMFICATDDWNTALLYSPYKKHEIWRFLTYMLLHSDGSHILTNIILQMLASFFLETEQGHLRVFLIFVGGGVAGSLGTSVFQPKLLMIGASAGVYSLLMSHVPNLIINFNNLRFRYFRILAVIILCTSDIIFSIYHCILNLNTNPQIGVAAHLAGAVTGILLGFGIYSYSRTTNFGFELIRFMSLFGFFILFILAIHVNFYYNEFNIFSNF